MVTDDLPCYFLYEMINSNFLLTFWFFFFVFFVPAYRQAGLALGTFYFVLGTEFKSYGRRPNKINDTP